mgnify:FL=1
MLKESVVVVRVSDELKEKISMKAEKLGLSSSSYIRTLVIKDLE